MAVLNKIKRAVRGEVKLTTVALEAIRRSRVSLQERKERAEIHVDEPLSLTDNYARMSADELLAHFRGDRQAKFFDALPAPDATEIAAADRIVDSHSWPLLGFGEKCFGGRYSVDARSTFKLRLAARLSSRHQVDSH